MTTAERVKQCKTPQEALLLLAAAIDALQAAPAADPWLAAIDWTSAETIEKTIPFTADNRAVIENGDVVVLPVSPQRQLERSAFFVNSRLDEFITELDSAAAHEAYVKGGPRWLYYTNREAVMQMPVAYREALVADVLLDSPSEAAEIGADILKFSFDEGNREAALIGHQRENRELGPAA